MLGISVYPYKENIKDTMNYIETAANIGYKRMFLNLLFEDKNTDINKFVEDNRKIISFAKSKNIEIYIDVNPKILEILGVDHNDLKFFSDLGVDGIRLDGVYDGNVESELTYNEYDLKIELNASQNTYYIDNIVSRKPNIKNLISCHNFYPQRYTALGEDFYVQTTEVSKNNGLRLATFVTSQAENTHGPHPFDDKLPTLEMHRDLDIAVQVKHLIALGNVDDIIISNSFASVEELKRAYEAYKPYVVFKLNYDKNVTKDELEILHNRHVNRGDLGAKIVRSSMPRVVYKETKVPNRDNEFKVLEKGTVYICNENMGQYKGEICIAYEKIEMNLDKINIIGKIVDEELFLLDYISDFSRFGFEK